MNRWSNALLACAMVAVVSPRAGAQMPFWIESFTAPGGAPLLQSFTWGGFGTTNPYTLGLYGFNGTQLTTGALWSQAMSNNPDESDVQTFAPDVALAAGGQYAIGLTYTLSAGQTSLFGNPFPGGQVYMFNGSQYAYDRSDADIENFSVQFGTVVATTTTPEPASLALLGTGLAGMIGLAGVRRRRNS